MVTNSELRRRAREQLGGNIFSNNWLLFVVVCIVAGVMNTISSSVTCGIGGIILAGPILYGYARLTANLANGQQKVEFSDFFKGFTEGFGRTFLLGLMTNLFTFLWSLLFIVPGIVKYYAYSMAPYIMQDDPNKNWKQCLDESQEMMEGHKGQLFCLHLSFVGWILLGMLCLGVGTIFVVPYMQQSTANFYLSLKEQNS